MINANESGIAIVVNDDETQLRVLAALVQKAGLVPCAFLNAEEALSSMASEVSTPAILVTDLYMPGIDGWRFCRLLRSPEYARFNHVPVLVVSATFSGDEPDRIANDLGAEAFLAVPVEGDIFIAQVQSILDGKRRCPTLRVLIVEDSHTVAGVVRKAFMAEGASVELAVKVKDALRAMASKPYDVAVLDYHLPDGLGDSLLERMRAEHPDCVCVMMTTDSTPELALSWMKAGASAYLRKPFEPAYLLEVCARARRERSLLRAQDLLERRTHELRESEERYQMLFREMLGGFALHEMIYDDQGHPVDYRFMAVNPSFERLTGLTAASVLGKTVKEVIPGTEPFWIETYGHVAMTGKPVHFENHSEALGRIFEVSAFCPVENLVACVFTDVTARRKAEADRELLQSRLNQSQKMESVGRLAGGIAHDFNNMLGVILGHTELALERVKEGDPVYHDLKEVRKAAIRSADLTRQLLAFARKQTVAPKVLDLNATVDGMLSMLRRLIGEDIQLVWVPGSRLGNVLIDPSQVDQIMANLCVNARDAIRDTGRITIETLCVDLDASFCSAHDGALPGKYIMLAVSDTGCGMDKATLANIFDPFFTTKPVGEGTGLGLSTVYGIVKQNHGYITVYSEVEVGTTFKVYLPLHSSEPIVVVEEAQVASLDSHGKQTILVVEDESAILNLAVGKLRSVGYTVISAGTPSEALREAQAHGHPIHLLLTDVVMPEMNGQDLAGKLKLMHPGLRCIFMSGYTANVIAHHGVLDVGVHFLQKPFTMKALVQSIQNTLS